VKTNKNKTNKGQGRRNGRLTGGDNPRRPIRTYHTASFPLPRVTEMCVVKGTASAVVTATPTAAVTTQYAFQLSNCNVGTGFWDQYRIDAIRFTITPQNNAIGLVTNSTTTLVPMYCVIDYDDASSLASVAAAESYSNCIVLNPGESLERVFQPRVALAAYTGSFGGYANMAPTWIDAASNTVQHYGIKLYVPGTAAAQTLLQSWDVTIEYFVSFRKSI